MSRVGEKPIPIPADVEVSIDGGEVTIKGPKGSLGRSLHTDMNISMEDGVLKVQRPSEEPKHRALHGLTRSLLANMVTGVTEGFVKVLDFVGVGYRVQQQGNDVILNVMLSHPVEIKAVTDITLEVEDTNRLRVRGIDKQLVGQVAAQIRAVRPPNVYTGKGIRYAQEIVRLKPGKSARRL